MSLFKLILNGFIACFIFILLNNCSTAQKPPKYLNELTNISDFNLLNGKPLSSKYGEVEAVKVVYDIEKDKIYFLNSKNYKYHHGFCRYKLGYSKGLEHFNAHNYAANSKLRKYILGNINYYKSINQYIMDISPADLMGTELIEQLYAKITKASYFKKEVSLLLNTSRLIELKEQFAIKTIAPEDIYKNQQFQSISSNTAYGYLKFVTLKDLKKNTYGSNDILVLEETPLTIPLVAGIIASEFQTPLSHLSILGKNRDIAIMAYKDAFNLSKLKKYKNKFVKLTVNQYGYTIKISNSEKAPKPHRNKKTIHLKKDLSVNKLVNFNVLKNVNSKSVGNKAKNFATLQHISINADFKVPENAFAIPFYFYDEHIKSSNTQKLIDDLLLDLKTERDSVNLKKRLKKIRKSIQKGSVSQSLIDSISKQLENENGYVRFRFRSSTNAEDMDGFSGAGLYTSKSAILGDTTKTIETALKKVWASLWNVQAFNERSYFSMDQTKVAMGILVHRSFPNEIANGVAITKNIYRESNMGYVINIQVGNNSVVEPKAGEVCDQVICYESSVNKIYTEKDIIEVITKSSLNNNKLIMTDLEMVHLSKQLEIIKKYFYNRDTYYEFDKYGLDVEFKLDTEKRKLYIKQVRHYNG